MTENRGAVKKPSFLSQLIPYAFALAILVYVFTGLSSRVVDERHAVTREWTTLKSSGARDRSIAVLSADRSVTYCSASDSAEAKHPGCPHGGDFETRRDDAGVSVRLTEHSRIPQGAMVSVDYAKKVRITEVYAMIEKADLRLFLPLMILHCIIFFLGDTFSFGLAYRFFNTPDITLYEMMECRGAPYVIQVVVAPLAEVLFPLYMLRVKKAPITDVVSSNVWTMLQDLAAQLTAITPAVIYNAYYRRLVPSIGPEWLFAVGAFWIFFIGGLIFWHSPLKDRASAWIASGRQGTDAKTRLQNLVGELMQLLRTFSMARWHHFLRVYVVRLTILCSALISNYVALRAMGVDPSAPLAAIAIPIVVLSVFMPIGVGGYGGPQLIAWFLFVQVGKTGTADQVIAYSFLWSTGFLIGRAVIGMIFIRGFWKRTFAEGFKI